MDDKQPSSTLGPDVKAALDKLNQLRRDVLSDQVTFNRRKGQLATMLADCAAIRVALAESGGEEEEQPA